MAISLERGFTWKTFLAILFMAAIILPISLYLYLMASAYFAFGAIFITAILFSEISRIMGSPMKKQELFLIYSLAGEITIITAASSTPALMFVWRRYFMESFITLSFRDPLSGLPLPMAIPDWWAPPLNTLAYEVRSLFLDVWVLPILVTILFSIFGMMQEIALTSICSNIYLQREVMPFPWAKVDSQLCITLAERDPEKFRVFTISAVIGILYSLILYGVPTITGAFGSSLIIIPIPWFDMTTGVLGIEKVLPGAIFGIATDPIPYVTGFILPLSTVAWIFIGSISVWTLGNWLALTQWSQYFPEWANEWTRGMTLSLAYQRSNLRVWIGPQIGFLLAAAVYFIAKSIPKMPRLKYLHPINQSNKDKTSVRGLFLSLLTTLILYFGGGIGIIILTHILIPDFPIWIVAIFSLGASLISAIVATRTLAETGVQISIPYLWSGFILLSGYKGLSALLISPVTGGATPRWVNRVAGALYTGLKPKDFFKAIVIGSVIVTIFSFVYVSIYWMIAPIPSSIYPATLIWWPLEVLGSGLWLSRQIATLKIEVITWPFAVSLGVAILLDILNKFMAIPFSFTGLITGFLQIPAFSTANLIGGLISTFVLKKIFKEKWESYRILLTGGIVTGVGVMAGISAAIAMMTKAGWVLPY